MGNWSPNHIRDLFLKACAPRGPILGLGTRAFPRLGPAFFSPAYEILCLQKTGDLPDLRAIVPVECLQERAAAPITDCRDTLSMLKLPLLRRIQRVPPPGTRLLVYQENPGLRALAALHGWDLMASSCEIRLKWENKAWFRARLAEVGLPVPPTILAAREELSAKNFRIWSRTFRTGLVIQIPSFPRGGGRATFFLEDAQDAETLGEQWKGGVHRGYPFREILVSPWIDGPSLSMVGCVLPNGVLLSPVQTQLVDLPEVLPPGRGGRFCGHQWGYPRYPSETEQEARKTTEWVGRALGSEGYRGIFGVDFVMDHQSGRLYALECNPRYTGAFPALTLLQTVAEAPPMEAFHLLAFLPTDQAPPIEELNARYAEVPAAAQVILFHRGRQHSRIKVSLDGGRYRQLDDGRKPVRVGRGLPLFVDRPDEFYIVDGPLMEGAELAPGNELERIARVIFPRSILTETRQLDDSAAGAIRWIYSRLGLEDGPCASS